MTKELGICDLGGKYPHKKKRDCKIWRPLKEAYSFTPGSVNHNLRGYTSAERKEIPVQDVLAGYFPDAFAALARHSKKANDKHNPGEPMHWAREKSKDHLNCAVRHLMTPDTVDPDTGEIELVGALWRCAAALQLREEARLTAAGIRPLSGVVPSKAQFVDDGIVPIQDRKPGVDPSVKIKDPGPRVTPNFGQIRAENDTDYREVCMHPFKAPVNGSTCPDCGYRRD